MTSPRKLEIDGALAGSTLAAAVRQLLDGLAWSKARDVVMRGGVQVDGVVVEDPAVRLRKGQHIEVQAHAPRKRAGVLPKEAIVYFDRDVVVVNKSAGLLTVPYSGERDTLIDQTRAALRRQLRDKAAAPDASLGVVQRLDRDTTGLLVFARSLMAKRHLQQQLRARSVKRRYLALVHGHAATAVHDTHFVPNRGDGLRGSWGRFPGHRGGPPSIARRAITRVRLLERFVDASLVACELQTGRQHQIRIHLSEAGHPLLGEPVYNRDFQGPWIEAPRPMLHAEVLGFEHPRTGAPLRFQAAPPDDFEAQLAGLRRQRGKA